MEQEKILGHYFPCCQFCVHDGNCELKHFELMGLSSAGKVDDTPYPGHENLVWHLSVFQDNRRRGTCAGRIMKSGSIFIPLICECGTAINSFCKKFTLNKKGRKRLKLAKGIAKEKRIELSEIDPEDLPPLDPNYEAIGY